MHPVAPSASGSAARQVSPDTLPKKCPTCIVCEGPLFDRRPVAVTDCPHRFHSHCTRNRRVDWQLADCRCTVCGAGATDVIKWFDKRYGSADLRCKLASLEACRLGYYSTVVKALNADPSFAKGLIGSGVYETGQTLIHEAAAHGRVSIVEFLLGRGAAINLENDAGDSPLLVAVSGGFVEVADLLLRRGAKDLHKAFAMAATQCDIHMLRMLIERGAGLDIADHDGNTPLAAAIRSNNSALFNLLLDSGADVNASGGLAIKAAMESRNCLFFVGLIKKGADVFGALDTGETPMEFAKRLNYEDEVRILYAAVNAALCTRMFAAFDPEMTAVEMSEVMDTDCLINGFHGIDLIYDREDDSDESDT